MKPLSTFGLVEHMTIKADRAGWLSPSLILWDFQDGPVGRKVLPILASDGQLYNLGERLNFEDGNGAAGLLVNSNGMTSD